MRISRNILHKAVAMEIINEQQVDALFNFINNQPDQRPHFNLNNLFYYFGGFVAIGAMSLFMNLSWSAFGGWGIFILSLIYAAIGLGLAEKFHKKLMSLPASICATFVVCLTPIAIYAVLLALNSWPENPHHQNYYFHIQWNWIYMELGTLIVGIAMAWKYRYAFMILPIILTLWCLSMDITALSREGIPDFSVNATVSMWFGLVMMIVAFWVDIRSKSPLDYAFWLYLVSVVLFWGGMTAQDKNGELLKFFYLCINLLMMGVGVILMRKIFDILGAIGSSLYLAHLMSQVFQNSVLFPIALTIIGFVIIYLGTLWQKNAALITKEAQSILPKSIQELLQSRQIIQD